MRGNERHGECFNVSGWQMEYTYEWEGGRSDARMPEDGRDMALAGEWLGLGKERRGSVDWLAIGFM